MPALPPQLVRGRCQIYTVRPETFGDKITIRDARGLGELEIPDGTIPDMLQGIGIVKDVLDKDLRVSIENDIESCLLHCSYDAFTDKDETATMNSLWDIEGLDALKGMVGFKYNNTIKLYPRVSDSSLRRGGWVEVEFGPNGKHHYRIYMVHLSSNFDSSVDALRESKDKATQIAEGFERKAYAS